MPSDIRSFFGPKGGAAPKPAPRKAEELAKSKRTSELTYAPLEFIIVLTMVKREERLLKIAKMTMMRLWSMFSVQVLCLTVL
jgi:hypothetical protein